MKFSIITVCKNAEKAIERTMLSVVTQTYQNIEYIIVDGASTDKTLEIVKQYSEKHSNIKWMSETDSGIYQAMNKGIKLSTGDIIAFLNAGDYYLDENVVSDIFKGISKDASHLIYFGHLYGLSSDRNFLLNFNLSKVIIDDFFFFRSTLPHLSTFYRKEVFDKHGLYDEKYKIAGDYEHFVRCCKKHKISPQILNTYVTYFNLDGISFSDSALGLKNLEIEKLIQTHFSKLERFLYTNVFYSKIRGRIVRMFRKAAGDN